MFFLSNSEKSASLVLFSFIFLKLFGGTESTILEARLFLTSIGDWTKLQTNQNKWPFSAVALRPRLDKIMFVYCLLDVCMLFLLLPEALMKQNLT